MRIIYLFFGLAVLCYCTLYLALSKAAFTLISFPLVFALKKKKKWKKNALTPMKLFTLVSCGLLRFFKVLKAAYFNYIYIKKKKINRKRLKNANAVVFLVCFLSHMQIAPEKQQKCYQNAAKTHMHFYHIFATEQCKSSLSIKHAWGWFHL